MRKGKERNEIRNTNDAMNEYEYESIMIMFVFVLNDAMNECEELRNEKGKERNEIRNTKYAMNEYKYEMK